MAVREVREILIEGLEDVDLGNDWDADKDTSLNLPNGRMSVSRVNSWMLCGEAFRRQYVDKAPRTGNVNLFRGKLVHALAEDSLNLAMSGIALESEEEVEDFCSTAAAAHAMPESREENRLSSAEFTEQIEFSKRLFKMWYKEVASHAHPIAVEKEIKVVVNGVPILGYIDYINMENSGKQKVIRDIKVTKRAKSERDAMNSLQLAVYGIAEDTPHVGFDSVVTGTKVSKVVQVGGTFSTGELVHMGSIVRDVAEAISAGIFPKADPTSWKCTEKFCSFWAECRGKKV
jgi:hypothetical protein